jgi:alkylation response protein AidB-like acyl-CoA dehydrogenase
MESDESLRDELLAEVEAVAPILTEHAPESEKLGRLDESSVGALRETRLLCFGCPRELGGCEADPVTTMEILEALTRVDGSAGWTSGILAITSACWRLSARQDGSANLRQRRTADGRDDRAQGQGRTR